MDGALTPLQRFFLAFVAFFAVLFNRRFAEEVAQVRARTRGGLPPAPQAAPPAAPGRHPAARPPRGDEAGSAVRAEQPVEEGDDGVVSPPRPAAAPASRRTVPAAAQPRVAVAPSPAREKAAAPAVHARPRVVEHAEALHVLSLLQRDGRLVDFLAEDLTTFSDAEIGAAARTVHAGCKKALEAYLELEPVFRDPEGATVTVDSGFDPAAVRLTGNVVGAPPFRGALRHHGWRATKAAFPPVPQQDPKIIAPAEVEL
jgi:Domain of unknown function (DUF2760)